MIHEIEPNKLINIYENVKPKDTDLIMIFHENSIYIRKNKEDNIYLTYKELKKHCKEKNIDIQECIYLFKIGTKQYFLANEENIQIEGFYFCKMYDTRRIKNKEQVFAASTAWHLNKWYRSNQFCGECGEKLYHDDKLRVMRCKKCGNMVFPMIAPAVIVGVINGDKIVLTKYANRNYTKYALIAGFTEIGESAEETVKREVKEEVGLCVKNITYYKSQPWGYDSNLLMGFFAELDGDDTIKMDEEELAVAEWIDRKEVPEDKEQLSLTGEMMQYFKNSKNVLK